MAHLTTRFFADSIGQCARCEVLLPDRPQPGRPIPTLYLLHGLSDDETIWMRRTAIERYASRYYLAVVMPCGGRSFYNDTPGGEKYFTYVTEELPDLMERYFPLSRERSGRFIAGLSMGGWGALKSALARPDRYAAVAGLSSVCSLEWLRTGMKDLYDADFGAGYEPRVPNDLFAAADAVGAFPLEERPKVFQYCGVEDFLIEDNRRLRARFEALGFDYVWEEGPGGHCWENWDERIQHVLSWLPLQENLVKTGAIGI